MVEHADLRHWDPAAHSWVLEPGEVELRIAKHSRHVHDTVIISV